jgi:hypothetical protein
LSDKTDVIPGQNVLSDPAAARRFGAAPRAVIESRYSIRTARAWLDAYRSLRGATVG